MPQPVSGSAGSRVALLALPALPALLISLPVRATSALLVTSALWDLGVAAFGHATSALPGTSALWDFAQVATGTFAISPFCPAEQSPQVGRRGRVSEGVVGFSFVTPLWGVKVSQYLVAMIKRTTTAIQ